VLVLAFAFLGCSAFAVNSFMQTRRLTQQTKTTKLTYTRTDLTPEDFTLPVVAPIAVSPDRLLVPVGDTLYMLGSNNHILWHYSFEPDIIYDVTVDAKGDIYVAAGEALILVLNSSGKEVWRTGMSSGSASYSQIRTFGAGFLVVIDMDAYRRKGSTSDDILQFWKDKALVWEKPFPRNARLQIVGNRILAIVITKDGREITEILRD
jgi:hypothetical protein